MAVEPFVGEIDIFAFNFAPNGWAQCNGDLITINGNEALYSLLGTTYGGDGVQTFRLPDLRGRANLSFGQGSNLSNYVLGAAGGEAHHALTTAEMPVHNHNVTGLSSAGDNADPTGRYPATAPTGLGNTYGPAGSASPLAAATLASAGSGQPHENQQPYLALTFCISLYGIYPTQN